MAFTEEQREQKWRELRSAGEDAWWAVFASRTQITNMVFFKILMIKAADLRALTTEERTMLLAARDVAQKLDQKIVYLDSLALDQEAEFNALSWTSTP
jgi:hypothetical protein